MTIWLPKLPDGIKNKYEAIAKAIGDDVAAGELKPGEKLPTQRELAKRLSVTVGTVGRAYALAEKKGFVSLETGRGSFVRSYDFRFGSGDPEDIIDLGLNLPAVTDNGEIFSRTLAQLSNSRDIVTLFGNAPVESFERHRVAATRWLRDRLVCSPEQVLISSGTQNALVSTLATLTKPGDSVLVEELTFPGMIEAARLLNLKLVPLEMDDRGIIPTALERCANTSGVIYCIPTNQNPTTTTMPTARRRRIAEIAKARELYIIEDDVYGKLIADAPPPIATFAHDRTVLISSLAKTMSVGLRLAFVCVPDRLRQPIMTSLRATNFFPSPLLCEIAANWINDNTADRLLKEQRVVALQRQEIAKDILGDELCAGNPAGNHVWLNLPDAWTGETLQRAAKENGVKLYPAAAFTTSSQAVANAVRIALGAARNESELRVGLNVIARLLDQGIDESRARY